MVPKSRNTPQAYTVDSAAIRYYHSRPYLLAMGDRHYCKRPLLQTICAVLLLLGVDGSCASDRHALTISGTEDSNDHSHSYFPPKIPADHTDSTYRRADPTPLQRPSPHTHTKTDTSTTEPSTSHYRRKALSSSFFPSARPPDQHLLHLAKRPSQPTHKTLAPDRRRGRVLAASLLE
jgi:hypothetical protein